jgi:hypothetical protein
MDFQRIASKFNCLHLNRLSRFLLLAPLLILPGCASVSVGNIHSKGVPPKKLPEKIYVRAFVAPTENFRVDRNEKDLNAFIKEEQKTFSAVLVAQLSKHIAPAEALPADKATPRGNFWLITGVYDRVNQGSRALRIGVGFGAGGTKLETRVLCSDLNARKPAPFLSMLTTGGSGLSPGAWAAFTPAGAFFIPDAVANAGGASLGGLSVDRARTAREITAALSEYCFANKLIAENRTRRPKKLGMFPSVQRPDFVIPKKGL